MEYTLLTDEELVKLAQEKDADAVSELMVRYKNYVKVTSRSFFLIDGDSEDLLQEGMLGIFKAITTFNGRSSFKSYVYLCIRSNILTAIKKSNREKHKPLNNALSLSGIGENEEDKTLYVMDKSGNPEALYISKESEIELNKQINDLLSELELNILRLYLKGYSYSEIGESLSKDSKSVDNAIQRIKKKLSIAVKKAN